MANILVTGGAGFIGGNFVHYWAKHHPDDAIIILDSLTYAGNVSTVSNVEQAELIIGDIRYIDHCAFRRRKSRRSVDYRSRCLH